MRGEMSRRAFVCCAASVLLAGCSQSGSQAGQAGASGNGHSWASDKQLHVAATFYPMADFATKIAGDAAEVVCLVPGGTEPHDWEPSPADIITIQSADLLVYNGVGIDSWVDSVLKSLGNEAPATICASDGINLLKIGDATDPHVWLDPRNAAAQVASIAGAFAQVDPDHANDYHSNMTRYVTEFNDLSQEYANRLTVLPKHEIVVSHEAYGYLCKAYALEQIGIEGLSPDSEPDAARMAEIVDLVKSKGITTIFFEELVSPKVAEAIAADTGAKAEKLSPLEGLSDEDIAAGKEYVSVMRDNLDKLEAALQ